MSQSAWDYTGQFLEYCAASRKQKLCDFLLIELLSRHLIEFFSNRMWWTLIRSINQVDCTHFWSRVPTDIFIWNTSVVIIFKQDRDVEAESLFRLGRPTLLEKFSTPSADERWLMIWWDLEGSLLLHSFQARSSQHSMDYFTYSITRSRKGFEKVKESSSRHDLFSQRK